MDMKKFYEEKMYGIWREGENVCYERLGEDPAGAPGAEKPKNPFAPIGGELVKILIENNGRTASFVVHAYIPTQKQRADFEAKHDGAKKRDGLPFLICMHPIFPKEYLLEQGVAVFFMDCYQIASDDIRRLGAFYDLYPYTEDPATQTGGLMAWAWGASKVLDAVYSGLDREFGLDAEASMVTGVSRWGKATAVCGAFDPRFRLTIPTCSGAGGLALYNFVSEGRTYDLRSVGGPEAYTYTQNEPLGCLQSDAERGWFIDRFLDFKTAGDITPEQDALPVMAMDPNRYYFIIASYTGEDWVNAPAMWECYKRANAVYEANGLADHLVVHFHLTGHAVILEDAEWIVSYFDHMYYQMNVIKDLSVLKTTAFAGQEGT